MTIPRQTATFRSGSTVRAQVQQRRANRPGKHFLQHLTCRSTTQKVQAPSHSIAKSHNGRGTRRHQQQLQMLSEMARNPAAPGLLFTAAAVKGFSVLSEVASNAADQNRGKVEELQAGFNSILDRASVKAEEVGAEINRQLRQASDNIAEQTETSQAALEDWKGLMNDILSEEASKLQADFDDASARVTEWRQQAAESFLPADNAAQNGTRTELNAHPLSPIRLDSLPRLTMPQLESGWLVDAVQQRFPDVGAPNAWPTSFSLMSNAESSTASDEEEVRSPTSPSSLASHFMQQARQMIEQSADSISQSSAKLEQSASASASSLVKQLRDQTSQLRERTADSILQSSAKLERSASASATSLVEQLREQTSQLKERTSQLTVPSLDSLSSGFSSSFSSGLVSSPRQRNGWRGLGTRGQQSREQLSQPAQATRVLDSPDQATNPAHAADTAPHAASPSRDSSPHTGSAAGSHLSTTSPAAQSQPHSVSSAQAAQSQPHTAQAAQSQQHTAQVAQSQPPNGALHRPVGGSSRGSASSPTATSAAQTNGAMSSTSPAGAANSVPPQASGSDSHAIGSAKPTDTVLTNSGVTGNSAVSASVNTGESLPSKPVQASQPVSGSVSQPQDRSVTVAKAQGLAASAPVEAGETLPTAPVQAGQPIHGPSERQSAPFKAAGKANPSLASPSASGPTPFESQRPAAQSKPAAAAKGFASWFGVKDPQRDQSAADSSAAQSAAAAAPAPVPQETASSAAPLSSSPATAANAASPLQSKPTSSDATAQQAAAQSSAKSPSTNGSSSIAADAMGQSLPQEAATAKPESVTAAAQEAAESSVKLPEKSEAVPKPLQAFKPDSNAAGEGSEAEGKQGKSRSHKVRVVRPDPTPNWRTPRPLTPPPGPVQQGHPLSASPTLPAGSSTAEPSTSFETDHVTGKALSNDTGAAEDAQGAVHTAQSSGSAKFAVRTPGSSTAPTDYLDSRHTPTTAAATAVDHEAENIVIDSIPWGVTGTATAKGRTAQTQTGGGDGGGGISGGSTGGSGGGRSSGQPGGSGGNDDGDRKRSWWSSWVPALIAGGGAGAAAVSNSSFKQTIQETIQAVKSKFVTGESAQARDAEQTASESSSDGGDEGAYNDADAAADLAADEAAHAASSASAADNDGGIETNIRIKEGDTAWSLAEEYSGSGAAWPEIVSSNPDVDMAKPRLGATVRVRVRL